MARKNFIFKYGIDIAPNSSGIGTYLTVSNRIGYIGIGTTNPQAKLHVAGTIIADNFTGNSSYATLAGTATNVSGGTASVTSLNVTGVSTLGIVNSGNIFSTGIITASAFSGNSSSATALQNSRNFSITGNFVTAPSISFDGSSNVALAATITADSIVLGTYTSGDYVKNISGTTNQITVTGGTGESSIPVLSIPNQFNVPQDLVVLRDLQVNRNLNVNGNITIGGTSATLFTTEFKVGDPDIVLGFRTDGNNNDISTDNTANHGGIAIASTEGTPLVQLYNVAIGETSPATYKKFMWFKNGSFSGLGTDAWLSNYAVGIGSTQFPTGTRLAAGSIQFTERDLAVVRNINASGVITATTFSGSGASLNSIPNSALNNSTISGISLGSNLNTLTLNTSGTGLSGSATYNGSSATTFTVTSNATSSNTGSTIVARDSSGNFSAGTITATLSGNQSGGSISATTGTFSNYLRTLEQVRATGWYGTPTGSSYTGLAVEMGIYSGQGYIDCYNRDTGSYGVLNLQSAGTSISLPASGSTISVTGAISATGTISGTTGSFSANLVVDTSGTGTSSSTIVFKRSGQSTTSFGSYSGSWRTALQLQNNDSTKLLFLAPPENDYAFGILKAVNGGLKIDVGSNGETNAISIDTSGNISIPVTLTASADQAIVNQHNGNSSQWYGRILSKNSTNDKAAFLGTYSSIAGVFAHNNALNAWADLYVNTVDGSSGGTVRMPSSVLINGSQALHAGNYNSYSPTLTGTGASGTWSINVTGNAATATSSPLLSALGNYVWSASTLPTSYNMGIQCSFVQPSNGWPNYGSVLNMVTYSGGGGSLQLYVPYSPGNGGTGLQVRFGNYEVSSGNSWTAWKTLLASDNYSSYALPLSGGTLSGALTISGNSLTVTNIYNNAWFRNQNSGEGLYNTATTNHWYSSSGAYWDTSCGGNAAGGIRIRQGYESTLKGYVYFDSSGFGLLDSGGSWSYRTTTTAAEIYKTLYTRAIDVQNYTISNTGPITPYGVSGNSLWTRSSYPYSFGFQEGGDWTSPYPDLVLQYHTGVTMAANPSYGGIRFKADYNDETLIFQVNGGSNYLYKYYWMYTNTTGFYSDTNGAHLYPNTGGSYGQWRLDGSRNSYGGIWDSYSAVNIGMYDSAGNGGVYREANGRWYLYHNVANTCMGVNTSSTSSSYGLYVSGGIYSTGNVVAYSDERKKTDIQTITSALDKVNKLRGVTYKRIDYKNDDVGYDNIEMGVIAQEVQEIVPEVVTYAEDIDEYGVSYGNFAGLFIEAIKEQTAIINNLKKEIEDLKSKLGE